MGKYLKTPQVFFISLAVFISIIGFYKKGTNLDLNYFLAFLLVDVWSVAMVSAVFFLLISMNYASLSLVKRKPKKIFSRAHIILQVIALIPLVYLMLKATEKSQPEFVAASNIVLIASFIVFLLSVILHLIGFFMAILSKNKS